MAVMTTQQSEGVLLEKMAKTTTIVEKDFRNGNVEVNGHASPAEIGPANDSTPNPKGDAKIDHNEEAFATNQAVSGDPHSTQEPQADASTNDIGVVPNDAAADSEMPDAQIKSPSPSPPAESDSPGKPATIDESAASAPSQTAEALPSPAASSAISPGAKGDVVMEDAHAQLEQSPLANHGESTQQTAVDETNDAGVSPTHIAASDAHAASPSAPATADTSLSEPSQAATKVSRERDIDSEDEPVAKRAKVGTTADAVEVKTRTEPDRMEVDQPPPTAEVSLYKEDGKPKGLADPSLNDSPITSYMGRQLRQVLAGVKKTKAGASFKASVQELWPTLWSDYSAKVSDPIDIGTMEKKLRGDLPRYGTMGDFKSDIALLLQNSVTFNGPDHEVTGLAKQLHDTILHRMAGANAAEPAKSEKKEPAKQHTTRHAEPRATAQPVQAASPQRPPKNADAPPKPPVESSAYAIPANNNGVPLIRRDSTKGKRTVKPTHPKDIPYDNKRKKKLSPELRFCDEVLTEIRKAKYYDCNNAFLQPVDPVALQIPTYHRIVRKPMDLQTMKEKLDAGEYTSSKEFEKDFELIVKNCRLFNGEHHLVYKQALDLQQLFKKEFGKKDEWLAKHAPAPATPFHAASPAPKDESEDEDHESEAEAEAVDPELKSAQARVATIQRRLVAEQQKVNDMINTGSAGIDDVEVAQSVVALLQKSLMAERVKLTQLQQKQSKPKPAKSKKAAGGGGGKKAVGGATNDRPAKKAGGNKKAAKRKMGVVEKEIIAAGIAELEGGDLEKAIDIIKRDTGQGENDSGELELDIEQLSDAALVKLYDIATTTFPDLRAKFEQSAAAAPPSAPPPAPRNKPAAKNKKNKPMSKSEQERRIAQLNELRAQAVRQGSGSQEPMESIEGNGNGRASTDPVPNRNLDSEDEESSEEE